MQIVTIYSSNKWAKNGVSIIKYNILTRKWTSVIDNITLGQLINQYPYLYTNEMISTNYNPPYIEYILESSNINDILEPSLNPFEKIYINKNVIKDVLGFEGWPVYNSHLADEFIERTCNQINLRHLESRNLPIITDNVDMDELFRFTNDYIEFENKYTFDIYKRIYNENITVVIPEELWMIIFEYYKYPIQSYDTFFYNIFR
jgi:hypothetical protein